MIGTVVQHELLLGSRRSRMKYIRWLYVGWIIIQILLYYGYFLLSEEGRYITRMQYAWMTKTEAPPITPNSAPHIVGLWFSESYVKQLFIVLAIATPALAAGAITDEKRRGTLQYLMLTDLGTRSLLLGKLFGRMIQVGMLALVGLPLFSLLGAYGGVDPLTMFAFLTLALTAVFAMASAALLASVWCRQTRDAVLALYGFGAAIAVAVWQFGGGLEVLNPFWVLNSVRTVDTEEFLRRLALSTMTGVLTGCACLGLAMWRIKPAYLRELEGSPGAKARWYGGRRSAVGDEPVRWRERNVEGLSPLASLRRIPYWLAILCMATASTASSCFILAYNCSEDSSLQDVLHSLRHFELTHLWALFPGAASGFLAQSVIVAFLASFIVGIRCSGAVTGERERQTWEPLLLTPLNTRDMINGKLWGIMGASYGYLVAYAGPALVLSAVAGPLALIWTGLWLGVTLLAMYFIGATGLWASVRSKSSWQALLWTLGVGYVGAAIVNAFTSLLVWAVLLLMFLMLISVDLRMRTAFASGFLNNLMTSFNLVFFAICISLALCSWLLAAFLLSSARSSIAKRERTKHWPAAPVYRRSKRRPKRMVRG
jgi:ABC-type transport system involved in multi-copper enzyme maturation permease subunit